MQAHEAVDGLKVTGDKAAAAEQIKALYKTFAESDCTMVEVRAAKLNVHAWQQTCKTSVSSVSTQAWCCSQIPGVTAKAER